MGFVATKPESTFEKAPPGIHIARCFKLVDIGLQKKTYQGQDKGEQQKIMVTWELLGEDRMADGEPFTHSEFYWMTLGDKAKLRQHIEAWRGKTLSDDEAMAFDISKLLGAYCQLNLVESVDGDKTYINLASIVPLPKGFPKPEGINPIVTFDMDNPDMTVFEGFSDKMKEMLKGSRSWYANRDAKPVAAGHELPEDETTPF